MRKDNTISTVFFGSIEVLVEEVVQRQMPEC